MVVLSLVGCSLTLARSMRRRSSFHIRLSNLSSANTARSASPPIDKILATRALESQSLSAGDIYAYTIALNDGITLTALIQRGDVRIELFQVPGAAPLPESGRNPSEGLRTHGVKHFAFREKDIRAALAQLQAKGAKGVFKLHDYPGAAFAFVSDNAGNAIELIQHKIPLGQAH